MSPSEIWDATIRELTRELVVMLQRREDEDCRDLAQAWTFVALSRHDRLPPLRELVAARRGGAGTRRQSRAQQTTVLHLLSDRLGTPLRRTRLVRRDSDGR